MLPAQIPAADSEIVGLGSAISDVIAAAKAPGATALGDAQAALPGLMQAIAGVAKLGDEIKKPANQAYIAWAIAQALEPA